MKLKYHNTCYVLVQTNMVHPIADHRFDLMWYPERGMPFLDQIKYKPYVKSIVTENPWFISCYSMEDVQVWRDGEWVRPDCQTYGASVNFITMKLLGWKNTIPSTPLDGGQMAYELTKRLEVSYGS